jgi:hypothetical protein
MADSPLFRASSYYLLGLKYELHVIKLLESWNMRLVHSGQPQDRGIDFYGTWSLPDISPLSVIGQCKRTQKPLGSRYLREWEGVLSHEKYILNCLGILATTSNYTSSMMSHFQGSNYPLMLLLIEDHSFHPKSIQLNKAAQNLPPALAVGHKYDYGNSRSRPILFSRQYAIPNY